MVGYYRQQLATHGWTVRAVQSDEGAVGGDGQVIAVTFDATRGGAVYQVVFEQVPGFEGRVTSVVIRLRA